MNNPSDKKIRLIPGIEFSEIEKVQPHYRKAENEIALTLSASDYSEFFEKAVELLDAPIFFFAELPKEESQSEYSTYYLDNCTLPVIKAILKRYSGILFSDGVLRFGFGSHSSGDEIFMQEYQQLCIYAQKKLPKFDKLLSELGYSQNPNALTIWDYVNEDSPISGESVECDGETAYDMVENLKEVGMYEYAE